MATTAQVGMYSVLADETKDNSKVEQLAIVIRYLNIDTATQHEQFLTYVKAAMIVLMQRTCLLTFSPHWKIVV